MSWCLFKCQGALADVRVNGRPSMRKLLAIHRAIAAGCQVGLRGCQAETWKGGRQEKVGMVPCLVGRGESLPQQQPYISNWTETKMPTSPFGTRLVKEGFGTFKAQGMWQFQVFAVIQKGQESVHIQCSSFSWGYPSSVYHQTGSYSRAFIHSLKRQYLHKVFYVFWVVCFAVRSTSP